jgi:hypothetical protein
MSPERAAAMRTDVVKPGGPVQSPTLTTAGGGGGRGGAPGFAGGGWEQMGGGDALMAMMNAMTSAKSGSPMSGVPKGGMLFGQAAVDQLPNYQPGQIQAAMRRGPGGGGRGRR